MKRGLFCVLFLIFLLACCCAHAAAVELPDYHSHRLDENEISAFFDDISDWGEDYGALLVKDVYNHLENKEESFFGMNFAATQTLDQLNDKDYKLWNADFVLTSNKPVSILMIGNYYPFGTIPIPQFITLKPGEKFRVLDYIGIWGTRTYYDIVNEVKSFNCAAMLVTNELLAACKAANIDDEILNTLGSYIIAEPDTRLSLSLNLYETDSSGAETGKSYSLGNPPVFAYKPIPQQLYALPQTGDSSSIAVWTALCAACLSAALIIRKKHASIR